MSRFNLADPNVIYEQQYRQMLDSMAFIADRAREACENPSLGGVLCDRCKAELHTTEHPLPPRDWVHSGSNHLLSEPEVAQTLAFIKDEEQDMELYDKEFARLLRLMDLLLQARFALQARLDQRRNLLSPMRRIPNEVWANIFEHVCNGTHMYRSDSDKYALMVHSNVIRKEIEARPLIISHVSSHWRNIIVGLPRLWSSISVNVYGLNHNICPLLDLFLQNSKDVPLQIEIADVHLTGQENGPQLALKDKFTSHGKAAVIALLSGASRYTDLKLDLAEDWEAISFEDPPSVTFPILRSFRTCSEGRVDQEGPDDASRWFWDAIHSAPNLKYVKTDNFLHEDMVPYAQLTTYKIHYLTSTRRLLELLELASNLESFEVNLWNPQRQSQARSVTCSSLRSLFLRSYRHHSEGYASVFDSLGVPSLTDLGLRCGFGYRKPSGHSFPWQSLKGMIERSSCSLLKLSLYLEHDTYADSAMLEFLHGVPTLAELEFHFCESEGQDEKTALADVASKVMESLCIGESHESRKLLPRLSKVLFKIRPWGTECDDLVVGALTTSMERLASSRSSSYLKARGLLDRVCPLAVPRVEFSP
uniref:F-box domain-containing protein n=1 Tax=Moniliophthora roreri TaxID=221103 RepID=A0A0W0F3Z4_MONRR